MSMNRQINLISNSVFMNPNYFYALIFSTGKLVITGVKSKMELKRYFRRVVFISDILPIY